MQGRRISTMTRNEPVARGFSASTTKLVVLIKKFRGRDDDADDTSGSCGFDLLYGAGRDARTFVFASTVFRRLTLHRIGVAIASQQQHRVLVHHDEESDGDLGGQARFELFLMGTVRSLHPRLPYLHVRAKSTSVSQSQSNWVRYLIGKTKRKQQRIIKTKTG